jgi:rhodanese-related sulfurtransferase
MYNMGANIPLVVSAVNPHHLSRKGLIDMSAPATINSQDLSQLLGSAAPPRVLDVRTPGEFEVAHIAGAYNVPLDLLREHRDEIVKHLDQDIVLVCRSGQRAAQAEETLSKAGLDNVHILEGGITAWEAKGFAVIRGAQRWDLERQVRLVAGSIVLSSILGSIAVPKLNWVAAAIGGGLTVASLTNTCAMGTALSKLPYNRGATCDAQTIVSQLVGSRPADQKAS